MAETITCPSCGKEFEVSEALAAGIRAHFETLYAEKDKERTAALAAREKAIKAQEAQAQEREAALKQRMTAEFEREAGRIKAQAAEKARETVALELRDQKERLKTAEAEATEAKKAQLALLREKDDLEKARAELDLTIAKRLDEEREALLTQARQSTEDEYRLSLDEKANQIKSLQQQIGDLKRRAEQGSEQLKGETLEVTLEDTLQTEFPHDEVEPVPKGVAGADLVQRVHDAAGRPCGTILWESKRTKHWSDTWLPKLKDDQRALGAEIAALVSIVLPTGAAPITQKDGVWITEFRTAIGMAHLLRKALRDASKANAALAGKQDKMDMIYAYLTGPQFKNRIEGLLEPFMTMRSELETEKRAIQKQWAKREKQLQRAFESIAGMHGDIEGIAGSIVPGIAGLDLPGLAAGEDETEAAPDDDA